MIAGEVDASLCGFKNLKNLNPLKNKLLTSCVKRQDWFLLFLVEIEQNIIVMLFCSESSMTQTTHNKVAFLRWVLSWQISIRINTTSSPISLSSAICVSHNSTKAALSKASNDTFLGKSYNFLVFQQTALLIYLSTTFFFSEALCTDFFRLSSYWSSPFSGVYSAFSSSVHSKLFHFLYFHKEPYSIRDKLDVLRLLNPGFGHFPFPSTFLT